MELEENLKYKDVSLGIKIKLIHALECPITIYGHESWTLKKNDKKKWIHLRRVLQILWTVKKTNMCILD